MHGDSYLRIKGLCAGLDKPSQRLLVVAAVRDTLRKHESKVHGWAENLYGILDEAEKYARWEMDPGLLDDDYRAKELRHRRDEAYYIRLIFWNRTNLEGLLMAVQETAEKEIYVPGTLGHCCGPTEGYSERMREMEGFVAMYLQGNAEVTHVPGK